MTGYSYTFAQVVQISLLDLWSKVLDALPNIVGAVVIIILGLIIAPIFGGVARRLVDLLKIDSLAQKVGAKEILRGFGRDHSISSLIGKLVKWFFILAFLIAAADILKWDRVTQFLNEIIFYIPQVLIAVIILVFGVIAGKFFESVVIGSLKGSNAPVTHPEMIGSVTRWSFIIFASLAALLQLGIAPSLIQILFGGLVLSLSLAFGLGGRDKAAKFLDYLDGSK